MTATLLHGLNSRVSLSSHHMLRVRIGTSAYAGAEHALYGVNHVQAEPRSSPKTFAAFSGPSCLGSGLPYERLGNGCTHRLLMYVQHDPENRKRQ